jgi:hypothetical protein
MAVPAAVPQLHGIESAEDKRLAKKDDARFDLARGAGVVSSVTLFAILGCEMGRVISLATAKDLALVFLTPLFTITASVFGYYFGSN